MLGLFFETKQQKNSNKLNLKLEWVRENCYRFLGIPFLMEVCNPPIISSQLAIKDRKRCGSFKPYHLISCEKSSHNFSDLFIQIFPSTVDMTRNFDSASFQHRSVIPTWPANRRFPFTVQRSALRERTCCYYFLFFTWGVKRTCLEPYAPYETVPWDVTQFTTVQLNFLNPGQPLLRGIVSTEWW
jgi:hypothetical protein